MVTGNDITVFLKSPGFKLFAGGALIFIGALIAIPFFLRDDDNDAIVSKKELTSEEKEPIEFTTDIKRFRLDKDDGKAGQKQRNKNEKASSQPKQPAVSPDVKPAAKAEVKTAVTQENRREKKPKDKNMKSLPAHIAAAEKEDRIFVLSEKKNGKEPKEFCSERYAAYGRLIDCKLINTLESNIPNTPLIGVVLQDLWWINSKGEKKLIIPAGTEVHGRMGGVVRNRMMCQGKFVLVWQAHTGEVGMELQIEGIILEKSNLPGDKNKAMITDMAAGIPGRVMKNNHLNEMMQYCMAFANGLASGYEEEEVYVNGQVVVQKKDGTTKNAMSKAIQKVSEAAMQNIAEQIAKESNYVRVAAGTEFYLYVTEVTDVEKGMIADTLLRKIEDREEQDENSVQSLTQKLMMKNLQTLQQKQNEPKGN